MIGGFNSHQLLPHLDWQLIGDRPKILCGYSDITALHNAIFARTGMVIYSGPHYSTFGMREHFDDTLRRFVECLFQDDEMDVVPAATWSDDLAWFLDQDDRHLRTNEGWWPLNDGSGAGTLIGGNASTLQLLNGTQWAPPLAGSDHAALDDVPVLANVDFGHTNRMMTFPIGGHVTVSVGGARSELTITRH